MPAGGGRGGSEPATGAVDGPAPGPGHHDGDVGPRRVLTLPNAITVGRLLGLPVFLWLLFARDQPAWAAVLLGALGATDWVDGQVARRFGQVSELGKVLDPTVDRVLLVTAGVAIVVDGSVPTAFAVASLSREVLLSIWMVGLTLLGAARVDVAWVGKAGTFGQMVAWPVYLGSTDAAFSDATGELLWAVATLVAVPSLFLSWIAFALYVPAGREALRAGREERERALLARRPPGSGRPPSG